MTETLDFAVPGLEQPAEIAMDRWGIPHIRAASRADLFFVQGFEAARDRLWQLDMWRKRGLGRLAADFGPGFLAQDRAARLFLYRGDMDAEWAAYGTPEARAITEAFTAGINAWITLTEADPGLLPPEFAAMDTRPERWEPADVVRIRSHALVRNVLSEAARARILHRADPATALLRTALEPDVTPIIPEGLTLGEVPDAVLDVFRLATARLDISPDRLHAGMADAWRWTQVSDLGDVTEEGSNNWAVSGTRTATGRPILASDPHRAHALPSLRRIVHLSAPGIDVIGAGEPVIPGISIGHNGHAAFGLTIFPMDQEDLFVYQTDPDDPDNYRHGDGWEPMRVIRERIAVRGVAECDVVLKFTRHGPVVYEDKAGRKAFAVRSVWFEPGAAAYFASLAYMEARTPEAFHAALRHWCAPSVNQVYADQDGHIGWFVAGRAPIRETWDGLLPVPGDGQHDWAGFQSAAALPFAIDPPRGFVATANELNVPTDHPLYRAFGFEWAEPSRARRIHAVLDGQPAHTLAQSMALQTDTLSLPATRLSAMLAATPDDGAITAAKTLLGTWDFHLAADSAPAALQEVWWSHHLKPAMLKLLAPDPAVRALLTPGDVGTLLALLEQCHPKLGDRDALLARTLAAAMAECHAKLGEDSGTWAWGRLHHAQFTHPLGRVASLPSIGPLPIGGSGNTPMAAGYRISDFRLTHGASFRMVVDVGDWDQSRAINTPGQSGDPRSPHYGDLAPTWAAGEYVPLLYSREAVDAATAFRIRLTPG
jgi:penicillin amidase